MVLGAITACAYGDKSSVQHNDDIQVSILGGLYLGSLLTVPEELKSPGMLKASLSKDWYTEISKDWYTEIAVSFPDDKNAHQLVKNCQDYFGSSKAEKQPVKEYERSAYMEFGLMCMAARDTANARPATSSYLKNLVLDGNIPGVLPKQLAMLVSETEYKKFLDDKNKVHWGDVNRIAEFERIDDYKVVYRHNGGQQEIGLFAKGDFNMDSIEDILITSRDSVTGGSYNSMRMFLMTKYALKADYVLLEEYKPIINQ